MNEPRFEGAEREGEGPSTPWEARVATIARSFVYPPAPDLSRGLAGRQAFEHGRAPVVRPAWAVALVVIAISFALLAVPQVRAAVMRVFQLGVVRIFVTEPSPAPTESPTAGALLPPQAVATTDASSTLRVPVTATPFTGSPPTALPGVGEVTTDGPPTGAPEVPPGLAGLAGRMTLEEARQKAPFPIWLPEHPPELGQPDYVFVQRFGAPAAILAWLDESAPGGVGMSLWMFLRGSVVDKLEPRVVTETTVHGQRALWTEGEHMLQMRSGEIMFGRLVQGNTLIWEQGDMTFRLETGLPLEEAVKVAESVRRDLPESEN